ncbi:MAG: T9SS type A sorting domain-containing protein [candidate division Zixibacteria bacterium]|nr:T9SS type A sorting domain-containing protein [candidate division Zixibacteria bacterium]
MKTITKTLIILLILSSVATADYHYASHEGSNEYPYTSWETAADSIQNAIDASVPGDTVYVGDGEFYEGTIVVKDTVALIGMGCENTKVHSTDDAIFGTKHESLIKGIWIEGEGIDFQKGIYINDFIAYVEDCKITDCYDAIRGWGGTVFRNNIIMGNHYGFSIPGSDPIIEYNTIINNEDIGISLAFARPIIRNNFIVRNGLGAIICQGNPMNRVDIYNNIIYDNCLDTYPHGVQVGLGYYNERFIYNNYLGMSQLRMNGISLSEGSSEDSIVNNIFNHCRVGVSISNSFVYIYYNTFFDNSENIHYNENAYDSLVGNIYTNPMVTSEEDGFRLQAYSPCIDAGHPDILDADGTRSDIGAYGGPYGISYVYEDYPPEPPDSVWATVIEDTIIIEWSLTTEADFNHYNIYRATNSGFPPSPEYLIAESDTSIYKDTDWDRDFNYYYLITSVDNQTNESEPSEELAVIFTSVNDNPHDILPKSEILQQNYPNPFNPTTTIRYILPDIGAQPAEVKVEIYNLLGEKVKTLVEERKYPSNYSVTWDGSDNNGNQVSSGVYFYNIKFWGIAITPAKKMVLVR